MPFKSNKHRKFMYANAGKDGMPTKQELSHWKYGGPKYPSGPYYPYKGDTLRVDKNYDKTHVQPSVFAYGGPDDEKEWEAAQAMMNAYDTFMDKHTTAKQKYDEELARVTKAREDVVEIGKNAYYDPEYRDKIFDYYIKPGEWNNYNPFYCSTRSCEAEQAAGYTIPEIGAGTVINKKELIPGNPVRTIPGTAQWQSYAEEQGYQKVDPSEIQAGDRILYGGDNPSHSLIYAGKGEDDQYWVLNDHGSGQSWDFNPSGNIRTQMGGGDGNYNAYRYVGNLPQYKENLESSPKPVKPDVGMPSIPQSMLKPAVQITTPVNPPRTLEHTPEYNLQQFISQIPMKQLMNAYKYGGMHLTAPPAEFKYGGCKSGCKCSACSPMMMQNGGFSYADYMQPVSMPVTQGVNTNMMYDHGGVHFPNTGVMPEGGIPYNPSMVNQLTALPDTGSPTENKQQITAADIPESTVNYNIQTNPNAFPGQVYSEENLTNWRTNLDESFTNPTTGKKYEETDAAAKPLIQGLFSNLGYDEDSSIFKDKDTGEKYKEPYQEVHWSAATTSNAVMNLFNQDKKGIRELGFNPSLRHSSYITDAILATKDPNYKYNLYNVTPLSSGEGEDESYTRLGVGDLLFKGRKDGGKVGTSKWKYDDFIKHAEENPKGGYPSHTDIITDIGEDEKGSYYLITGGNVSQTFKSDKVYFDPTTGKIKGDKYKGALTLKEEARPQEITKVEPRPATMIHQNSRVPRGRLATTTQMYRDALMPVDQEYLVSNAYGGPIHYPFGGLPKLKFNRNKKGLAIETHLTDDIREDAGINNIPKEKRDNTFQYDFYIGKNKGGDPLVQASLDNQTPDNFLKENLGISLKELRKLSDGKLQDLVASKVTRKYYKPNKKNAFMDGQIKKEIQWVYDKAKNELTRNVTKYNRKVNEETIDNVDLLPAYTLSNGGIPHDPPYLDANGNPIEIPIFNQPANPGMMGDVVPQMGILPPDPPQEGPTGGVTSMTPGVAKGKERWFKNWFGRGRQTNSRVIPRDGFMNEYGGYTQYMNGGNMGQFSNVPVTEFNNGGSHEANPLGGIPQGPNARVEEGELKIKVPGTDQDFIVSPKIVLDKDTAEEFDLPKKYIGKDMVTIVKKALRKNTFAEREGDAITENTKEIEIEPIIAAHTYLTDLKNAEEEAKKQLAFSNDMQNMMTEYPEYMQAMMAQQQPQQQGPSPEEQAMMEQQMMAQQGMPPMMGTYGGKLYSQGGQMQQGGQQEQIMSAVAQALQQGMAPEKVMGKLVEMGIPEEQAGGLIQGVMQQMQQGASQEMSMGGGLSQPVKLMTYPYNQMIMASGGPIYDYDFGSVMRGVGKGLDVATPFLSKINPLLGAATGALGAGLENVGTGADWKEVVGETALGAGAGAASAIPGVGGVLSTGIKQVGNIIDENTETKSDRVLKRELREDPNAVANRAKTDALVDSVVGIGGQLAGAAMGARAGKQDAKFVESGDDLAKWAPKGTTSGVDPVTGDAMSFAPDYTPPVTPNYDMSYISGLPSVPGGPTMAYGGRMKRYDNGGVMSDLDILKILDFESTQGSAQGTGLADYGIKPKWHTKYPYLKDGVTEEEAIKFIRAEYLTDEMKELPISAQRRLVDYTYNTGRNWKDLLLLNNENIDLSPSEMPKDWKPTADQVMEAADKGIIETGISGTEATKEDNKKIWAALNPSIRGEVDPKLWEENKEAILKSLKEENAGAKLDRTKHSLMKDYWTNVEGNPDAYEKSAKDRINMWNDGLGNRTNNFAYNPTTDTYEEVVGDIEAPRTEDVKLEDLPQGDIPTQPSNMDLTGPYLSFSPPEEKEEVEKNLLEATIPMPTKPAVFPLPTGAEEPKLRELEEETADPGLGYVPEIAPAREDDPMYYDYGDEPPYAPPQTEEEEDRIKQGVDAATGLPYGAQTDKYLRPSFGEYLIGAAPGIYDIARGMQKPEELEIDEVGKIATPRISLDQARRDARELYAGAQKGLKNIAPGGGSYAANMLGSYQNYLRGLAGISEQEENLNAQLAAQDKAQEYARLNANIQRDIMKQDYAAKSRAAGQQLVGSGLGYLGDMYAADRQNKFFTEAYAPLVAPDYAQYYHYTRPPKKDKNVT